LAKHSSHPISQAVAQLGSVGIDLQSWEEIAGAGVSGKTLVDSEDEGKEKARTIPSGAGHVVRLGSIRWLEENNVNFGPAKDFIEKSTGEGATITGLAINKDLAGLFAIKDAVKPGARNVIEHLQRQGFKTFLVTGDNSRTASSIAAQVGIQLEHVFAEVRPDQKAELVKKLQAENERIAFVGDGINDAPALEQADLGIAVSRASDIAREAADIILLKSEIEAVPESLGLARATLRTIKQNLFWAFFYNAIGIPLAALGFMSPILCAAAMGCSDLVVIGNALRLRAWRLPDSR
jgi:Cu+-exporting ATPase